MTPGQPDVGEAHAGTPTTSHDPWGEPITGLVLDLDDTLIDTVLAMHEGARGAAGDVWPGEAESARVLAATYYDDPLGCFDAYTRGEMSFVEQRRRRVEHAAQAAALLDGILGPDLEQRYVDAYRQHFAAAQRLYPDVLDLLDRAAEAGVGVCLLTNAGDEVTAEKLSAVGLVGRLPQVTTDTFGVGKPDPRVYRRAAELAGTDPQHAVCVGDTLDTDVLGARRAGLRVAWLQRTGARPPRNSRWDVVVDDPGVRIVRSLGEVAALLHPDGPA